MDTNFTSSINQINEINNLNSIATDSAELIYNKYSAVLYGNVLAATNNHQVAQQIVYDTFVEFFSDGQYINNIYPFGTLIKLGLKKAMNITRFDRKELTAKLFPFRGIRYN